MNDPAVAEKLIPTDHGFGMRRPPMETFYYEAYNRPNVQLVDLNETPIVTITATGSRPATVSGPSTSSCGPPGSTASPAR